MVQNELFPHYGVETQRRMEGLLPLIDSVFPLPGRFRSGLPRDVAELSRLLTNKREDREDGYLGKAPLLSAYLRYFLPWNVYRLTRLFVALPLRLEADDAVTDLGSGPLTVPLALWIARPELRKVPLEIRCVDRTGKALESGKALFAALAATEETAWKIRTIRGPLGTRIEGKKAALVTAANVFEESHRDDRVSFEDQIDRNARLLSGLSQDGGSILVVEPGIPRSGETISRLRDSFIRLGRNPLAPCPHSGVCPMPGGRKGAKWCHFAFDTEDAPAPLHRLSAAAGIPKERATLSFLLAGPAASAADPQATPAAPQASGGPPASPALRIAVPPAAAALPPAASLQVRVVSDAFPLEAGSYGRYACSSEGLTLVAGPRRFVEECSSGALLRFELGSDPKRDPKTGAVMLFLR